MSSRKTEPDPAVKKEPAPIIDVGPLSLKDEDTPYCPCIFVTIVHKRAICTMCGKDTGAYSDRWEQFT